MMVKDFVNSEVIVIVSTRGDRVFEYHGILSAEDDENIILKNVTIILAVDEWSKKHAPSKNALLYYSENLETAIINKKYMISCIKK